MSIKVSNFKLGMFIISGTTLLVLMVALFGAGAFSKKGLEFETYIDSSVQGLDIGAPLKYRGVKIGAVSDISMVENYYPSVEPKFARYVLIRMVLDPTKQRRSDDELRQRVKGWVEKGMRLRLASQGITGISFMEADFGGEAEPPMEISWKPSVIYVPSARNQFARILDTVESVARDLEKADIPGIARDARKVLDRVDSAISEANIKDMSKQVRDTLARADETIAGVRDVVTGDDFKQIGTKATAALDQVNDSVTDLSCQIADTLDETRGAVKDARGYMARPEVNDGIARIGEITRNLEATLQRLETSYPRKDQQVDEILNNLRTVSANLRDLGGLLSRYPSAAAFGDAPTPSGVYKHD